MLVKLEWLGYRMVKKLWRYVKPFSSDTGTLRTDRPTDRFAISISRVSMLTRDNYACSHISKSFLRVLPQLCDQLTHFVSIIHMSLVSRLHAIVSSSFNLTNLSTYPSLFHATLKMNFSTNPSHQTAHCWYLRECFELPITPHLTVFRFCMPTSLFFYVFR